MMDFTPEESALLRDDGYEAGWVEDADPDDLIALAPVTRLRGQTVQTYTILRADDADPRHMIGVRLDGTETHLVYGSKYPCFLKKAPA